MAESLQQQAEKLATTICDLETEEEQLGQEAAAAVAIQSYEDQFEEDVEPNPNYQPSGEQPKVWRNQEEWLRYLSAKGEPLPVFSDPAQSVNILQQQVRKSGISSEPIYQELTSYGHKTTPRYTEVEIHPPSGGVMAAAAAGEIQLTNIKPPRFDGDGTLNWEDFEAHIESQFDGKSFKQQRSLLQACLGPKPRKWYFQKDELWLKPISEQLRRLRNKYSIRRDGEEDYGVPHDVVMKPGETIDDYEMRVTEACVHLKPRPFKRIPGELRKTEAFREVKQFADKVAYDKMEKGVFIGGLPNKFRTRLFNNNELRAKPLSDIIDECKKWEKTQRLVKRGDVTNMQLQSIAFQNDAAIAYHTQKYKSESTDEESGTDDEKPKFVELANKVLREKSKRNENVVSKRDSKIKAAVDAEIAKEKQIEKQEKVYQTLLAKMEQLQEKVNPEKIQEQISSLGESLPGLIKSMMTEDTKPTAKAGTKGDPSTEDSEKQYQERQERYNNNRGGYNRGWGRGQGRGRGRGRGFGRGFGRGGRGGNQSNNREDEQQKEEGQSEKQADNGQPKNPRPDWNKMADAMTKTAAAMQQQTTAMAQLIENSKN